MATEKREIGQNVCFGKTGEIARVFSVINGQGKTLWSYCSLLNCNQWSRQNKFQPVPKEDDDDDDVCMISTRMIHDSGKSGRIRDFSFPSVPRQTPTAPRPINGS